MGSSLLLGIVTYISVCGSLQAQSYRFIRLYDVYIRHRQIEPVSKVGLSTSKKVGFICFNERKMMKNAFYFILKSLFVLEIFTFLS